jgi:hypothetical protein
MIMIHEAVVTVSTNPNWAGIVTAVTAVTGMVVAVGGVIRALALLRGTRQEVAAVHGQVGVVHEAVNNTAQKQNRRIDQLTAALTAAGTTVPPRDAPVGDEHPAA